MRQSQTALLALLDLDTLSSNAKKAAKTAGLRRLFSPMSSNSKYVWLERESHSLHHQLLQIFVNVPIDGSIAGTLYKHHKSELANCKKDDSRIPIGYLVKTDSSTSQELPRLTITTIRTDKSIEIDNNIAQEQLWAHATSNYEMLQSYFSRNLVPWFQNTPDKDDRSFDQNFIWLPVYDGHHQGRPMGCFLGWIFQVLPYQANIQDNRDRLYAYLCQCKPMIEYLAKDIYLASGREVLSQEMDPSESSYHFLCNKIYFMEGWAMVAAKAPIGESDSGEIPSDVLNALGYEKSGKQIISAVKNYYYQKISDNGCLDKIYIDLTSSRFEHSDKGLNSILNEESRILELTIGADFEVGENGFSEEHCNRIVNRLKTIYSRLKRTKGIIASAQIDIQKDLAATLSHTYTKVAEAVGNEIMMISPDTILDDIRRTVRMEENDTELRKEIIRRVDEIDNRSRTRQLEYTFAVLSKGIKTHYKTVTMMDRMPPIRPGSVEGETLQEYITGIFYNSFLPLARNISSRSVRDSVAKIEKHYRPREGDQWWRQCIRFSGFGEEILLPPQPVESHRSSDVIDMFEDLKESVFFELFLNAFSNEALGYSMCDRLFIDIIFSPGIQFYTLTFSNFILVNRANLNDEDILSASPDGWIEKKIERPSQHGGLSGWGMYGVKRSLENLLGLGQMFRYVNPSTQSGKIEIKLKPEWIGKK